MAIPGFVPLTGPIGPTSVEDQYPVFDPTYGFGGSREVPDYTTLNAIPDLRRSQGMVVYVQADATRWELLASPWSHTDSDWQAFGSTSDTTVVHKAADETITGVKTFEALPILDSLTGILKASNGSLEVGTAGTDYLTPADVADKATDSLVVHKAQDETITGVKTFEALPVLDSLTGILKATAGSLEAATAGTDYLVPTGDGSQLTGIRAAQVSYDDTASGLTAAQVQAAIDELNVLLASIPIPPGDTSTRLISGGGVAWTSAYTFVASAATYYVAGTKYSSAQQTVTLAPADSSHDRFDVLVLDTAGTLSAIQGDATPEPVVPVIDSQLELALTIVFVPQSSSTPGIVTTLIYDEDVGPPTEWTTSSNGTGWALASTTNPYSGTKDIQATNVAANSWVQFQTTTSIDPNTQTNLVFQIRSKASWARKSLVLALQTNGTQQGQTISLADGAFGFSSSLTTSYQQIVIPLSNFVISPGGTANQLRITVKGAGAGIGFYLDDVILQTQSSSGGTTSLGVYAYGFALGAGASMVVGSDKTVWVTVLKPCTLTKWAIAAKTPPTGSSVILDVFRCPVGSSPGTSGNWVSLFTTGHRPTLTASSYTASGNAFDVGGVAGATAMAEGDLLRVDIVQVGSTTPGKDLSLELVVVHNN